MAEPFGRVRLVVIAIRSNGVSLFALEEEMTVPSAEALTDSIDRVRDAMPATFTFWKGRVGLFAILKAAGIGPGDGVLVPGYTCAMVPAAVVHAGASSFYVDIDPATYNCSLATFRETWARRRNNRVKALILQHTFGIAADVARIVSWAKSAGITVIEDCAHAPATKYRDTDGQWRSVGEGGDAAFFSSQWSKPISTGLGGWVTVNDPSLRDRVRSFHAYECITPSLFESSLLATQVAVKELVFRPSLYWILVGAYRWVTRRGLLDGTVSDRELQGDMPHDFAKRMSAFQEWLLKRRLADKRWEARSRRLREIYDEELGRSGITRFCDPEYSDSVLVRYPIRVKNKYEILDEARRRHIEIGEWFNHPIHPRESNSAAFGYRPGDCPEGERAGREAVNLPMHRRIDEAQARGIVHFLVRTAKW